MSILVSLNSNALDIDQALYLQTEPAENVKEELTTNPYTNISTEPEETQQEILADELDYDLLGGFLSRMNK